MVKCVNKSSKEFKDTCSRLNISEDSLEIVVHEYQNTEGNAESFPSDSYIMERLKGSPTNTKSKAVMELWEKKYSTPQTFNSIEEANHFKAEASKFFDSNSIIIYKNNNGKYTISIAKPIKKTVNKNVISQKNPSSVLNTFKAQNDSLRDEFNILEKSNITDSEIKEIAKDFVVAISDLLTEYQNNTARIFEDFPELQVVPGKEGSSTIVEIGTLESDLKSKTREELLRFIGAERIVNKAYKQIFRRTDIPVSVMKLGKNTKALLITAYSQFLDLENFTIIGENGLEVNKADNTDIENLNKESEVEEVEETHGDSQEHWQIEVRTLDVLDNATSLVKRALSTCRAVEKVEEYKDTDGVYRKRPIYKRSKKTNIPKRIDAKDATSSILRWTRGSIDYSDMLSKLEAKAENNPWIQPIIERLKDNSGKESDFQSQFFKTFAKHFHSYCVVIKEKGKYVTKIVNENPALKNTKDYIIAQYNIGAHPLFNSDKTINTKVLKQLEEINTALKDPNAPIEELLTSAVNLLGYPIEKENISKVLTSKEIEDSIKTSLDNIVKNLNYGGKLSIYSPFEYKSKNSIEGYLNSLLKPIVEQFEDTAISSLYDNGKMYQSYITPSYMTKLMLKFKQEDDFKLNEFLDSEYKAFSWFYSEKNKEFRNTWLKTFTSSSRKDREQLLKHKTQLHFDSNYYMKGMTEQQYIMSVITEYFNGPKDNVAWYRMPMQSNKPASEFISFTKFNELNTPLGDYKTFITNELYKVFIQELGRIIEVRNLGIKKGDPNFIKNFHGDRGKHFVFLDFLNPYITEGTSESKTELGTILNKRIKRDQLTSEEAALLVSEIKSNIRAEIERRNAITIDSYKKQGIIETVKKNVLSKDDAEQVEQKIEEFLWNDTLATINILQLTITDPAYYKDTEDLQKRLAQLHSPGVRGNAEARDYSGRKVSDGKLRSLYLKDIELSKEGIKSNILENVRIVLQNKVDQAKTEEEKRSAEAYMDTILEQFEEGINIADAQSFSSPTSYRKKAFIFGTWSREREAIYEKIKEGKATLSEIKDAMQPLKPFTYSQISKIINGKNIKVPVQHKTAEYLLVMADAIIGNENTGKPNLLRAIFQFMEDSAKNDNTKGIDTILFESSVKSGLHGTINVEEFNDAKDGEAKLLSKLNELTYKNGEYNSSYIDEIPVEDYSLQQEVPLHYYEHSQVHGSQIRALLPSDLPADTSINGKSVKEFRKDYEETIAQNIQESIDNIIEEFGLDGTTSYEDKKLLLAKVLQKEVLSNSRYGIDLFKALIINEEGDFTIPLQDPIHSKRIEQLINSIIKNRINKQTIPGGPVVQVSNFGMSKRLNVRFKDANGELLKTRDEFKSDDEYRNYIKDNQKGIAYFECIAPASTKALLQDFIDEKGNLDVAAIEATNPDLLKAIGYRIPTEGKHSMQPLKIVGFAPREAGEVIVMPYEITLISGSDYDVDKIYMMRKDIPITRNSGIYKILEKELGKAKKEEINMFLDQVSDPNTRQSAYQLYPDIAKIYRRKAFKAEEPKEGRAFRNNEIVDMTYDVLTHESQASRLLKPGGFEEQKRMGYYVTALKLGYTKEELDKLSTSELKDRCYKKSNLMWFADQSAFYRQNSTAGTILGIFASERSNHAVLEGDDLKIDMSDGGIYISLGNTEYHGIVSLDPTFDGNGNFVGDTLGSLVAAAADAVKDPVLQLMNINSHTANILTTMLRIGVPFKTAALFLSSTTITEVLKELETKTLSSYSTLTDVIKDKLEYLQQKYGLSPDSLAASQNISEEQLIEDITRQEGEYTDSSIPITILNTCLNILKVSNTVSKISKVTRLNSMTSAVGPLMLDNFIYSEHFRKFPSNIQFENKELTLDVLLDKHPILKGFFNAYSIPKEMLPNATVFSSTVQNVIKSIETLHPKLYSKLTTDRTLLSKFIDFVINYNMINGGEESAINYKELEYFIKDFPKEFLLKNYKEKYKDNRFIQSIQVTYKSGNINLKIDTTGMDRSHKEELTDAWADLYKKDSKLATYLYKYAFFKGGIGFNPKTFMALLPNSMRISDSRRSKSLTKFYDMDYHILIDQFIGNNSKEFKVIKNINPKDNKLHFSHPENGNPTLKTTPIKLQGCTYFKYGDNLYTVDYFDSNKMEDEQIIELKEIPILGNNGSYLEISPNEISKSSNLVESEETEVLNNSSYLSSLFELEEAFLDDIPTLFDKKEIAAGFVAEKVSKATGKDAKSLYDRVMNEDVDLQKVEQTIKEACNKLGISYNEGKVSKYTQKFC